MPVFDPVGSSSQKHFSWTFFKQFGCQTETSRFFQYCMWLTEDQLIIFISYRTIPAICNLRCRSHPSPTPVATVATIYSTVVFFNHIWWTCCVCTVEHTSSVPPYLLLHLHFPTAQYLFIHLICGAATAVLLSSAAFPVARTHVHTFTLKNSARVYQVVLWQIYTVTPGKWLVSAHKYQIFILQAFVAF